MLASAAAAVLQRRAEVTERIVTLVVAQEPAYQPTGQIPVDVLSRSVDANVQRILERLAGVVRSEDEELAVARTTGSRRARQGVPLESVLRAFRLATQGIMDMLLAEARARSAAELDAFLDVATVVIQVVDRHSVAVVTGYRETEAQLQRRDAERRQAVFDALLEGRGGDPATAAEALSVLGLPSDGSYVVVVAAIDLAVRPALGVTRDACAAYAYAGAWRIRGDREIGIVALAESSVPRLMTVLRANSVGPIGISDRFDAMHEVPEAYRAADIALRTVALDSAEVAWIAERLPEALVVSSPNLSGRLARYALGSVLALPRGERELLLRTLAIWYRNGLSASRAAKQLYCHRNTILNRLRRIETLTGGSLEDPRHLLNCYLGLLTLELLPAQ
ncbi:helix-turn-helix domain-containing protein [Nocardia sp. NPDC005998]|uniref:PucR family transcriptional regulator n=1 Tax=Nocardia sp. NPDC005998 TaxID=3156894 RepID=UPI0033BF929D